MQSAISSKQENVETLDDIVYIHADGKVCEVKIVLTRYDEDNSSPDNHGNVAKTFSRHGNFDHEDQRGETSREVVQLARKRCMSLSPKVYMAVNVVLNINETYLMFEIVLIMQTSEYFKMVARINNHKTLTAVSYQPVSYQPKKRTMSQRKGRKICIDVHQERNKTVSLANMEVIKKVGRRNGKPRKKEEESMKGNKKFAKPPDEPVKKDGYRYNLGLLVIRILFHKKTIAIWLVLLIYRNMVVVDGSGERAQNCYASTIEGTSIEELDHDTICKIPELTSTLKAHRNSMCPIDDKTIILLAIMNGNYSCMNGYETKCMNGEDRLHFVCVPADIRCPKGFGWNISFDTGGEDIEIRLGKCKPGHFQETPSKCFDACRDEHFQPRHFSPGLKIYKDGDNINPQLLMCDFSSGYYNPENKSYIKADSEFTHNVLGFCVDSPDPCSEGQMVLHNGSCADRCEDGYERDAPDFTCKEKNDEKDSSVVRAIEDNIPRSISLDTGPAPPPTATTTGPQYAIKDNKKTVTTGILVIIIGFVFIVVFVVLYLVCKKTGVKPVGNYTAEVVHELHAMRAMIGDANGTDETVVHVATEDDLGDVTHHNIPLLQD